MCARLSGLFNFWISTPDFDFSIPQEKREQLFKVLSSTLTFEKLVQHGHPFVACVPNAIRAGQEELAIHMVKSRLFAGDADVALAKERRLTKLLQVMVEQNRAFVTEDLLRWSIDQRAPELMTTILEQGQSGQLSRAVLKNGFIVACLLGSFQVAQQLLEKNMLEPKEMPSRLHRPILQRNVELSAIERGE
jgi:hypothetical protein